MFPFSLLLLEDCCFAVVTQHKCVDNCHDKYMVVCICTSMYSLSSIEAMPILALAFEFVGSTYCFLI